MARKIVEEQLSVRELEKQTKEVKEPKKVSEPVTPEPIDPDLVYQLEKLQYAFGTAVKLKNGSTNQNGKIEIEYYSKEDIIRIFDILNALEK